jgi:transposase-like protein
LVNEAASVREQARHEGVSPSLIHRWRQRGMPSDLEGGSVWRARNATRRAGRAPAPAPAPQSPPAAPVVQADPVPELSPEVDEDPDATKLAVELAERPEEVITSEASCKEMLRAQRSSRQYAAGRIAACHKRGDEAMAQRWTQIMNNIIPKQKDTERDLLDLLERTGKTMTTEAAKRSFRTVFSELRQKLVAAPAALAAQLNPQDPHHAQGVMENYVRSLFKETYEDHQPTA